MTEKNSLKAFREITIQDQNPTRPSQIDQSKDYAGSTNRNKTVSTGTIFGSSAPTYPNFGTNYTTDSIFSSLGNYSYTQEDSKMGAAEIASLTIGGLSAALPLGMGIFQIVKAFKGGKSQNANGFSRKENKTINNNTENIDDTMTALNSTIQTAESLGDDAPWKSMDETSKTLSRNIETANAEIKKAVCNAETAKNNKKTIVGKRDAERINYNSLLEQKAAISNNLEQLNKQLTNADENMTPEQKSKIKEQISTLEKELKDIEKKINDSEKKITDFEQQIKVQEQIISNNETAANNLNAAITRAQKQMENLNKKINAKAPK